MKTVICINWICFTVTLAGALLVPILNKNCVVLYLTLFIFGLILGFTTVNYWKENRLVLDIDTSESW